VRWIQNELFKRRDRQLPLNTKKILNDFNNICAAAFKKAVIDFELIPSRMTQLVQPQDFALMKAVKSRFTCKWQHWYMDSEKSYTKSGNRLNSRNNKRHSLIASISPKSRKMTRITTTQHCVLFSYGSRRLRWKRRSGKHRHAEYGMQNNGLFNR